MVRIFKWIIFGDSHLHKWEIMASERLVRTKDNVEVGTLYTLKCKECGKITGTKVMI